MVFGYRIEGIKSVERSLDALGKKVYPAALSSTLNKTATTVRAQGARDIAAEMGISKVSRVKRDMKIHRATKKRLRSIVETQGSPLSLMEFKARQTKKGVSHTAYGAKRRLLKGAFIATMPKGGRHAFVRKTGTRKIKKLWGPGIARTMGQEVVSDKMHRVIDEKLIPTLKREIKFRAGWMRRR